MEDICVNFLDQVHFFRFLKGRCHRNQLCVVADFFAGSGSISGSAGPIFTILHHIVGIELQMINPTFFSDILRDVAMASNFVVKLPTTPCT